MKMIRCMFAFSLAFLTTVQLTGQEVGRLQIRILEGEGALNNIKLKVAHHPVVEVADIEGRPVAAADVVFTMPFAGPGGTINGDRIYRAKTDAEGRVAVVAMKPNDIEGRFVIKVEAAKNGMQGSTVIAQSNTTAGGRVERSASSGGSRKLLIGLLAVAGGGVAIGAATLRGGGSAPSAAAAGTSISVGAVNIGGPR